MLCTKSGPSLILILLKEQSLQMYVTYDLSVA